jgi:protein-S-isoprenylcysteine O-methyltransferase Ste14
MIELSFFIVLVLWILEVFYYATKGERRIFTSPLDAILLSSPILKAIGSVMVTVGLLIFVLALVSFGGSWRVGIDHSTPADLVTTGIFAISRNPIFVFIDLYFIGTFLINRTLILLIFAVLVVIGMHYQILQEEKFLSSAYGQDYENYCLKTGRYLGWRKRDHTG